MSKKRKRRRRIRRGVVLLGVGCLGLAVVVAWNVVRSPSRQLEVEPVSHPDLSEQQIVERLSEAIQIRSVSMGNLAWVDEQQFDRFHEFVAATYPELYQPPFEAMTGDVFGDARNRSLLFHWPGSDAKLEPILLMSHFDVVPIESETATAWTHPPFSGDVDDHYIWGRGALDVKDGVIGILEAVNHLLDKGFQPTRSIYISLGHDEETGGTHGNRRIAEWMRSQGIRLWFVVDEGGCILNDFPGMERPLALVGVAEKGFMNVRLSVSLEEGGHSSMPPPETAIGILSQAINRIERDAFPATLSGGGDLLLDFIGPEMAPLSRVATANRWLFERLIVRMLEKKPGSNAMLRTTVAPTMVSGGTKENVLPTHADAVLNLRLLPGDSAASAVRRLTETVQDPRVKIVAVGEPREASPISSTASQSFRTLHRTIREVYPKVVVAPFVLVGGTDAAHFEPLSRNVYRFMPVRLSEKDLKRIHGIDERIAKRDFLDLVSYFIRLIRNAS